MGGLSKDEFEAARPFLDALPDPVLWIRDDYTLAWRNRAAVEHYGENGETCFILSHGRTAPCDQDGELCPKQKARADDAPVSVVHAHTGPGPDTVFHRVLALPIGEDGVLEIHSELGDGMVHDELTGLYRRMFWTEIVRRDLALLGRVGRPYALLFLDLDHFKSFNDDHGHLAGDRLLVSAGKAIRERIRFSDAACRFGGEEFVVFLPDTDLPSAESLAEQLRRDIHAIRIDTPTGSHGSTISIGIHATEAREPLREALQSADAALYRAKQAGRDQIRASEQLGEDRREAHDG